MLNFADLITQVAAGFLLAGGSVLLGFLWKLQKTLSGLASNVKESQNFMAKAERRSEVHEARLEVHDQLWSHHLNDVVDSELISAGKMRFPHKSRAKKSDS